MPLYSLPPKIRTFRTNMRKSILFLNFFCIFSSKIFHFSLVVMHIYIYLHIR